jgi:ubiquinone/menaquinone biosynthesis C-methylase UbiE
MRVAAGSGIVTRALLAHLPGECHVVATDLNPPMIDYAGRQVGDERVTWRQADAGALPFGNSSFDVVACQFGVMFFPDKIAAYREARRVLRPGGTFLFSVWSAIERNDFADIITVAVTAIFPDDPPRFFARIPHGYHDRAAIEAGLRAAGFSTVTSETVRRETRSISAHHAAFGFCQGTPLRNEIEARDPTRLQEATEAAAAALRARFGDGPISGSGEAIVFEATR